MHMVHELVLAGNMKFELMSYIGVRVYAPGIDCSLIWEVGICCFFISNVFIYLPYLGGWDFKYYTFPGYFLLQRWS